MFVSNLVLSELVRQIMPRYHLSLSLVSLSSSKMNQRGERLTRSEKLKSCRRNSEMERRQWSFLHRSSEKK